MTLRRRVGRCDRRAPSPSSPQEVLALRINFRFIRAVALAFLALALALRKLRGGFEHAGGVVPGQAEHLANRRLSELLLVFAAHRKAMHRE
eukprot:6538710-Pyramimonas_sp.AAC.1